MASLNKCSFIGNLGKDPEIRSTQDGREIANISLGVSESWKDKNSGERKEKTEWVRIAIFNQNLVNVAKNYLKKGSKIYVEGQMQTRKWTDQSGIEKYTTEIVLQNFGGTIVMLDGKKQESAPAQPEAYDRPAPMKKATIEEDLNDDIPFAMLLPIALVAYHYIPSIMNIV